MKIAEVAREARDGAGFTRSMVAKAVDSFNRHAKFSTRSSRTTEIYSTLAMTGVLESKKLGSTF